MRIVNFQPPPHPLDEYDKTLANTYTSFAVSRGVGILRLVLNEVKDLDAVAAAQIASLHSQPSV